MTHPARRVDNVLFLGTGNAARSMIAECLLNAMGRGRFDAYSAGTRCKPKRAPSRSGPGPGPTDNPSGRGRSGSIGGPVGRHIDSPFRNAGVTMAP